MDPSCDREAEVLAPVCGTSVPLSAVDAVAISRSLSIEPSLFACLVAASSEYAPAAFALDSSGRRYHLAMRVPCPFMLRTRDGGAFCGLAATRPVCRLQNDQQDLALHEGVVGRWNAVAARLAPESSMGLADVCRYLMDALGRAG